LDLVTYIWLIWFINAKNRHLLCIVLTPPSHAQ